MAVRDEAGWNWIEAPERESVKKVLSDKWQDPLNEILDDKWGADWEEKSPKSADLRGVLDTLTAAQTEASTQLVNGFDVSEELKRLVGDLGIVTDLDADTLADKAIAELKAALDEGSTLDPSADVATIKEALGKVDSELTEKIEALTVKAEEAAKELEALREELAAIEGEIPSGVD